MFVEEDELERDKQLLDLRTSVLEAEEERIKWTTYNEYF